MRTPWPALTAWLVGLAVSGYLTFEHYTGSATLACPEGQVLNCEAVTSSDWAYLWGVPVALLGLLYFVAGTVFALVVAPRLPRGRTLASGAALTGVGVAFVLYLIYGEMVLGQICLWCTVVHLITLGLFVYYLVAWWLGRDEAGLRV